VSLRIRRFELRLTSTESITRVPNHQVYAAASDPSIRIFCTDLN
jgi:hypothetical protein